MSVGSNDLEYAIVYSYYASTFSLLDVRQLATSSLTIPYTQ